MTESSTVTKEEKTPTNTVDSKKVPVEALGEARAKTRAANERAEAAETEAKATALGAEDIKTIIAAVTAEARKQVEAEVAPYKAKAARAEMAMQLGLSNEQVDKVMEVKNQNPTLTDQQALVLAKTEHVDLFAPQQRGFNPMLHGSLPTSGTSDARSQPAQNDHLAKIAEARKRGDRSAVVEHTTAMVVEGFKTQFLRSRQFQ